MRARVLWCAEVPGRSGRPAARRPCAPLPPGPRREVGTQRKQATEALERSKAQLAEAQQIAHVGSWELDLDTQMLSWSDEHYRIFGLELGDDCVPYLEGLSHIHPDDRARVRAEFEDAIARRGSYVTDLRAVRP